jgi:23S rRNA pseudouridine1911/1915/1917 synthase
MQEHILIVDLDQVDSRLDIFLVHFLPGAPSRNFIQNLIEDKKVFVNEKNVRSHYKVRAGDQVKVFFDSDKFSTVVPEPIELDILYEDQDFMIIHKPTGMTVHPGAGCRSGTLVNALVYHQKELSSGSDILRPGIVHRLDKETSGLMVVAKNNIAHGRLSRQFERHRIKKQYMALVNGLVEFDEGMIDAPLGRHPLRREKRAVLFSQSKEAKTIYRVVTRFKQTTLVRLYPETGRTHQLRVHMAYLGHPILGDEKYGSKESFFRLALHAQCLGFYHPRFLKYVEFFCPAPKEFFCLD